jgi:hypothetical protein
MARNLMLNYKSVGAVVTVIALGGLLGWYFGLWGGRDGVDRAEYQNLSY